MLRLCCAIPPWYAGKRYQESVNTHWHINSNASDLLEGQGKPKLVWSRNRIVNDYSSLSDAKLEGCHVWPLETVKGSPERTYPSSLYLSSIVYGNPRCLDEPRLTGAQLQCTYLYGTLTYYHCAGFNSCIPQLKGPSPGEVCSTS